MTEKSHPDAVSGVIRYDLAEIVTRNRLRALRRGFPFPIVKNDQGGFDIILRPSPEPNAPRSSAAEWSDCTQPNEADLTIRACSTIIARTGETNGNVAYALEHRGRAYQRAGDYDHALADFEQAIQRDPKSVAAHYGRGWVYQRKGDYDRAIADFSRAIELKPDYAEAYRNRGWAYAIKNDSERAIADYRIAAELFPATDTRRQDVLQLIAGLENKLRHIPQEDIAAGPTLSSEPEEIGNAAGAASYEFLFTPDKVVSLTMAHAEVSFMDRFDDAALRAVLPGYDIEFQGAVEDWEQFTVSRAGKQYLSINGDRQSGKILMFWDIEGAIDAAGAAPGMAATEVFQSKTAKCSAGLENYCESEMSPFLSYVVGWEQACPVEFHDWITGESERQTTLIECMKIAGIELRSPELDTLSLLRF